MRVNLTGPSQAQNPLGAALAEIVQSAGPAQLGCRVTSDSRRDIGGKQMLFQGNHSHRGILFMLQ